MKPPTKTQARHGTGWLTPPTTEGGYWRWGYKYRGRRYRGSTGQTLKTNAGTFLEDAIRQIRAGTFRLPPPAPTLTGKDLAEMWLATYVPVRRNAKGTALAQARVEAYFEPFFAPMEAPAITKDDLRRYRTHLEGLTRDGDKPGTKVPLLSDMSVRHILADARCVFLWAADSGHIPAAPVPKHLLPPIAESVPRALTPGEQERVCSIADPWGFACRLMLGCGARWSEHVRLRADDLVDGELVLRPEADARKTRGGGRVKGRRVRRVPIAAALAQEIRQHVGKLTPFARKDDPQFVRKVRALSGVSGFGAHRLRHSFATNYLAAGGNLKALQEQMGHGSVSTTEIYAKMTQAMVREDARRTMGWTPRAIHGE